MLRSHRVHLGLILVGLILVTACSKSPAGPSEGPDVTAPVITAQPQSQTVTRGGSATLTVSASGSGAMVYQWYTGRTGETSAPVPGANASSYTTPALSATTQYWVRVSAGGGAADSTTATVAVDAVAPSIVEPPEDDTVEAGRTAYLFVEVTGSQPLTYQWFRGHSGSTSDPLPGATESGLTTPPLTETTRFWVRVSNPAGSVDSSAAVITVTTVPAEPTPPPPAPGPGPAPAPPSAPPVPDPSAAAFEDQVLTLVNQRRAAGATCGATGYAPAGALSVHPSLRTAARDHSQDMATRNYFSHTGLDGRTYTQRMFDAGFSGSGPYGENIGGGYASPEAVVSGWMGSAGHCQNIMNPGFRVAGVGYAYNAASSYGHYWTLTFAGN